MKISVCMATYNGEKYIKAQIESILCQLKKNDEVIISDNGSTDRTIPIIKSFKDERIYIFNNDLEIGVLSNYNNALKKANGDVIFLSDQDDIWLNNKVRVCIEKIEYYDLIVTNCIVTDCELKTMCPSYFNLVNSGTGFLKNIYKSTYLGCCLVFNRKVLDTILPIPKHLFMYHDWWIGFLAEIKYSVCFEETPLLLYRRHNNTTSNTIGTSKYSLLRRVYSRIQLVLFGVNRIFWRS